MHLPPEDAFYAAKIGINPLPNKLFSCFFRFLTLPDPIFCRTNGTGAEWRSCACCGKAVGNVTPEAPLQYGGWPLWGGKRPSSAPPIASLCASVPSSADRNSAPGTSCTWVCRRQTCSGQGATWHSAAARRTPGTAHGCLPCGGSTALSSVPPPFAPPQSCPCIFKVPAGRHEARRTANEYRLYTLLYIGDILNYHKATLP